MWDHDYSGITSDHLKYCLTGTNCLWFVFHNSSPVLVAVHYMRVGLKNQNHDFIIAQYGVVVWYDMVNEDQNPKIHFQTTSRF